MDGTDPPPVAVDQEEEEHGKKSHFLSESEWAAYKGDALAVEVKEKAEKKIAALLEQIGKLESDVTDVKIHNGWLESHAPPSRASHLD